MIYMAVGCERRTPFGIAMGQIRDITDPELPSSALLSALSLVFLTGSGDIGTRLLLNPAFLKLKLPF